MLGHTEEKIERHLGIVVERDDLPGGNAASQSASRSAPIEDRRSPLLAKPCWCATRTMVAETR